MVHGRPWQLFGYVSGAWLLSPAHRLELHFPGLGSEGLLPPLQTCHHHGGFALSSFTEQSQGRSPGFNKSSTISGPKGIGSTLDPLCLILPLIAYAWVDWTPCPRGFVAVLSSWDSFSKFTLIMLIFAPASLPDSSELQCHFRSYLIWEHIPAPEKEQAFIPACALSADLLTKLYM